MIPISYFIGLSLLLFVLGIIAYSADESGTHPQPSQAIYGVGGRAARE